jgi:hypothetical protein
LGVFYSIPGVGAPTKQAQGYKTGRNLKIGGKGANMKGHKVLIVLFCVLIGGCALPLGENYTLTREGNSDSDNTIYINDYNLLSYIPVPAKGEAPVLSVNNRGDLEITVVWKNQAGTVLPSFAAFQPSTVYKAEIWLTVKSGYAFNPSMPFGYPLGKIDTQIDDLGNPTRVVRVTYNNSDDAAVTFITDYNLQSYVPIPMAGEKPIRQIDSRTDMEIKVAWKEEGPSGTFTAISDKENFTFALGAVYQAEITLSVAPGYKFSGGKNFAYVDGMVQTQPGPDSNTAKRVLSPIRYKATREPTGINDLNLTPYILKPINNTTPVMTFAGPQYTGMVCWKNTETQGELIGPFQAGTAYTAELTLTPAAAYSFKNIGHNAFIHTGAESITNTATGGNVTIKFSATSSANVIIVYDTVLSSRIPKPIIGMTPVTAIAGSQYSGTVTWSPSHTIFQMGTPYAATLVLSAAAGYTFTGIEENVFSHGDAGTVINPAGGGTVTITFFPAASSTYMVIQSFGPVGNENSALGLMKERRLENFPLIIDLPGGDEEFVVPTILTAGNNTPTNVLINGHNRVLKIQNSGALITVGAGVTLTLMNITLEGIPDNNAPLLVVDSRGTLILGTGAVITNNQNTGNVGGVWVNDGSLILNDGAVINGMDGQQAGGVFVGINGMFNMEGGAIEGNTANGVPSSDGVYNQGIFYIYEGTIMGDVLNEGTFIRKGGTITGSISG